MMKKWGMHVARVMSTVQPMNDNQYNWMLLQNVCFGIFVSENQGFCLMYSMYYPIAWGHVTNKCNNYKLVAIWLLY